MSVTYRLPCATPLRYLPLVYILPHDLLLRCPTLRKLPRRMGGVQRSGMAGSPGEPAVPKRNHGRYGGADVPRFGFGD